METSTCIILFLVERMGGEGCRFIFGVPRQCFPPRSLVTHISCYTEAVDRPKQNVTLVIEEDLLLAARKIALDQRTSVNQLVREYLATLIDQPSRRRLARARLGGVFEKGLVGVGDRNWSRDSLYDR